MVAVTLAAGGLLFLITRAVLKAPLGFPIWSRIRQSSFDTIQCEKRIRYAVWIMTIEWRGEVPWVRERQSNLGLRPETVVRLHRGKRGRYGAQSPL